ncbi:hypothetical protein RY27_11980 [Litorilinea aerophila]|nr:hypothetical protein RY27_11980 [Litorilinea aerophila]
MSLVWNDRLERAGSVSVGFFYTSIEKFDKVFVDDYTAKVVIWIALGRSLERYLFSIVGCGMKRKQAFLPGGQW